MSAKFLFSMMICISLQGTQREQLEKRCPGLSALAYKAMSCWWKNDYHILAYSNACWMLRMKLKCRERMEDINRYYVKCGAVIQGEEYPIWVSPLHEAILRGHLQVVEILYKAGANKNLRIKLAIDDTERAEQQTGCMFIEHLGLTSERAQEENLKWRESNYVGFSALELAKELSEKSDDLSGNRQRIYSILR